MAGLFFLIILAPIIMFIAGFVMAFNKDGQVQKKGGRLMLWSVVAALASALIGFAICTSAF